MNQIPTYEEMSLKALLLVLRRRKWLIIAMAVVFTGAAAIFLMTQKPRYTAEAVLQFNARPQKLLIKNEAMALPHAPDEAAIKTELDVMSSRDLLQRVNQKLGLDKTPEFSMPGVDEATLRTSVADMLHQQLSLDHAPQTYTVHVGFTSGSPEMAAKVTNTLIDEYLEFRRATELGMAENTTGWLSKRIQELKEKVHASEEAVQQYQEEHNLIRLVGGETVSDKQLSEINTQLVEAQTATAQAEARLRQAQSILKKGGVAASELDSIPDVLKSEMIQQLKVKATDAQQRRSELSARYGAKHPQMVKVNSELEDIKQRIVAEMSKVVMGLVHELEVARIKQDSMEKSLKDLKGEMAQGTRSQVELSELVREKETNVTLYNEFLARYKETSHGSDDNIQEAQVVSYAAVPLKPSWPKKKLILAGGFAVGLVAGLALAFLLENLDKGYRTVKQLEAYTGVTVLGMTPDVRAKDYPVTDYVLQRPTSVYAESLRTIMTGVRFSNPDSPPKVVMVASSIPEEGKSMFSISLARLLAKAGNKVLLVDCDMRVPTTHTAFKAQPELCLENIIMDGRTLQEARAVDEDSGLHFIRTSGKTTHSQEMLGSGKMKEFIAAARAEYDFVVLDSPPLMALADGMVLSQLADSTIVLVRWESTPREVTVAAIKSLRAAQAKVAGLVLSRVNISKFERHHYNEGGVEYGKYHQYYTN